MATLAQIVAAYKRDHQSSAAQERRWFVRQPSLRDAVGLAALALTPGRKRFAHQRRIPGEVLNHAKRILLNSLARLAAMDSFESLHAEIRRLVGSVHGIGELYIYDAALRIGAQRGLSPKRVYVHAGVRAGTKNLGLDPGRRESIAIDELPTPLHDLQAYEIEDVLCIYKEQLAGAAMTERQSNCRGEGRKSRRITC